MLRTITMTAYRRPEYTQEVLTALAACTGIADWLLLANVEPGHERVISQFREWDSCEVQLVVNQKRLGLNKNTHAAVSRACDMQSEVMVHLEDDTVPSPDALHYFDWAVRELLIPNTRTAVGQQILLATGYNKPRIEPTPEQAQRCQTRAIWTPWGWGVDRQRANWFIANWKFYNPRCFTCWFRDRYKRTRSEVFPILSRIQNIGYEKGENGRSPRWYREHHRTPWVASSSQCLPFHFDGRTDLGQPQILTAEHIRARRKSVVSRHKQHRP